MLTICLNGCFDRLHKGHYYLLDYAVKLAGDTGKVVIAINSDESVKELKGDSRPCEPQGERIYKIVNHLRIKIPIERYKVIPFSTEDELSFIYSIFKPDMILHGDDITDVTEITGYPDWPILILPRYKDYSTTKITRDSEIP